MIVFSRFRQALKKFVYIVSEVFIFITIVIFYVKAAHRRDISNPSEVIFGLFVFVIGINFLMGLCTMCNYDKDEEGDEEPDMGIMNKLKVKDKGLVQVMDPNQTEKQIMNVPDGPDSLREEDETKKEQDWNVDEKP